MALVLRQQVDTTLPIEVHGITPDRLAGLSLAEIKQLPILHGNRDKKLGEVFSVSKQADKDGEGPATIRWTGDLSCVHWLGAGMQTGLIVTDSSVGRHVGSQMTGGEIVVDGDVSDCVGAEMTGGSIRVTGDAGDLVGANYPGSKFGMNRGNVFIQGNAGRGVGQSMRRGTIVVGGNCGALAGWNMLAGTIVVLGACGDHPGTGMKRGTITLAGGGQTQTSVSPAFSMGGTATVPVLRLLSKWLQCASPELDVADLDQRLFTQYHGDKVTGSRGELFIACTD